MKASPFGIVIVLLMLIDESSRGVVYVSAHIIYIKGDMIFLMLATH